MNTESSLNNNIPTSVNSSTIIDDAVGTMVYLIVVILWYSMGIIFLLAMDIIPRYVELEDSGRHRTHTKEILGENNLIFFVRRSHHYFSEELVDKQSEIDFGIFTWAQNRPRKLD